MRQQLNSRNHLNYKTYKCHIGQIQKALYKLEEINCVIYISKLRRQLFTNIQIMLFVNQGYELFPKESQEFKKERPG